MPPSRRNPALQHLDDDAELYALGLTEPDRTAAIEAHLGECAACRVRVADAESVAASLAAAHRPMHSAAAIAPLAPGAPRRAPGATASRARAVLAPVAAAAALVFAATAALEGFAAQAAERRAEVNDRALVAVASSHFGHVALTGDTHVIAKALYGRDGAWCWVIATGAPPSAHVVLVSGAMRRDAGALGAGSPARLFVADAGRPEEVEIIDGGSMVARGRPTY